MSPDDALSATVSTSLIFQSATRESTISTAGNAPAIARNADAVFAPGPSRSRSMMKAISASTRGCTSLQIDHVAVLDEHAVQQHAVVGFVDTEQFLHRLRRQSDLAAADALAVLDPPVDVHRLDRIGVLDGQIRMLIGKRRYRDRRLIGLP